MAEIEIERKPRDRWTWPLALVIFLLVMGTAWYLAGTPTDVGSIWTDVDTLQTNERLPPGTPMR
jgi:hypothetical protein